MKVFLFTRWEIKTAETQTLTLACAAHVLQADYQTDPEMTVFQVVDGDDFHWEPWMGEIVERG
jgi:hypothetical protein